MNRTIRNDIDLVALRLKRMGLPYVAKVFKERPFTTVRSWKPLVEDAKYMGHTDNRGMFEAIRLLSDFSLRAKDQGIPLKPVRFSTAARRVATRHHKKNANDRAAVTRGELPFYRGGGGPLRNGPAYFTSFEMMAKFYGPVTEYRLRLKNPKFVDQREWGNFDSIALRVDPSPIEELYAEGYDSAVWAKNTAEGRMYTVFALNGKAVSKRHSTAARRVAARHHKKYASKIDINALKDSIAALDDGLADIMDHPALRWRNTSGLAKAQSDIVAALSAYQSELEDFHREEARREAERLREEAERLEALVGEQAEARFKKLVKATPNAVLRALGNTWDGDSNRSSQGIASWEFTPQDWIDTKEGTKIGMTVAKAIAGSIGERAEIDRDPSTSDYDLVVEFPYVRVGIRVQTDSPDKWSAQEMREDGLKVPKKIIYSVDVTVLLWDSE